LKGLRRDYQHLSIAEKALDKTTAAYATNRNVSMSGYLAAVGSAAAGHPFAAPVVAIGHQVIKERGNALAAHFLGKLANLGAAEAATRSIDQQLSSGIRGYLSKLSAPVERVAIASAGTARRDLSGGGLSARYEKAVGKVSALASDPAGSSAKLSANMGSLGQHAPNVATSMAQKATASVHWLTQQVPPSQPSNSILQGTLKPAPPSDAEMSAFLRKAAVVNDPMSVVKALRAGKVTADQVDALKSNYPSLYAQVQKTTMEAVQAQGGKEIPYEKRKALGILLQIPTDATLDPKFIALCQQSHAAAGGQSQSPGSGAPKPKRVNSIHWSERTQSGMDAAMDESERS
jgi:hypothetical protein